MTDSQTTATINAPLKFIAATPDVIVPNPHPGVPVVGVPHSIFVIRGGHRSNREGSVKARVDPPADEYSHIVLYMKGPRETEPQRLESKERPTDPAQCNEPIYFYVEQTLLNDGVSVFTYEVERNSGNSGPSTESWALYYRDVPGGLQDPVSGSYSELEIRLPSELGSPAQIDKDQVDEGVTLTLFYRFMKPYDKITLELRRERFHFTVQPGQEGKPFVINISRAMFEQAGSDPRFAFSYTVVDQVGNPTDKRRWSKTLEANVDTERGWLEKPIIREIPTENSDDPATIDRGKMKGGPLWALVHFAESVWRSGDEIYLKFISLLDGEEVIHEDTLSVGQVPSQLSWEIPNQKVIAKSAVTVFYQQIRNDELIGTSKIAGATVIGPVVPELEMDTSPVTLSATRYYMAEYPAQFPEYAFPSDPVAGAYVDRVATGGVGTIEYKSSDSRIASVDAKGRVFARGNGTATITAQDDSDQSVSYQVTTSGVSNQVVYKTDQLNWSSANQLVRGLGGRLLTLAELQSIYKSITPAVYQGLPYPYGSWTATSAGVGFYYVFLWNGSSARVDDLPHVLAYFAYLKL